MPTLSPHLIRVLLSDPSIPTDAPAEVLDAPALAYAKQALSLAADRMVNQVKSYFPLFTEKMNLYPLEQLLKVTPEGTPEYIEAARVLGDAASIRKYRNAARLLDTSAECSIDLLQALAPEAVDGCIAAIANARMKFGMELARGVIARSASPNAAPLAPDVLHAATVEVAEAWCERAAYLQHRAYFNRQQEAACLEMSQPELFEWLKDQPFEAVKMWSKNFDEKWRKKLLARYSGDKLKQLLEWNLGPMTASDIGVYHY